MFDLARIGAGLPVAETIGTLPSSGNVVVQAPPGTGKTTLVPPALANQAAEQDMSGKILVTAPRRVAVRAAANRLQHLSGQQIGYAVRGDSATAATSSSSPQACCCAACCATPSSAVFPP